MHMGRFWQQCISTIIVATFLPGNVAYSAPASAIPAEKPVLLDLAKLTIPESFGTVRELFISKGNPNSHKVIFQIQDSHANEEAQTNIKNIVSLLAKPSVGMAPAQLIAVEAAKGIVDTSLIQKIPNEAIRKQVAEYFLSIGYLTGTEMYSILDKDKPVPLYGVEDKQLYFENLAAFRKTMKEKGLRAQAEGILRFAQLLRKKMFGPELSEIWDKADAYEGGKLPFTEFCEFLAKATTDAGIHVGMYENFQIAIASISREKSVVLAAVDNEKKVLIARLQKKMVKEEMNVLVTDSLQFRLGRMSAQAFYLKLRKWGQDKGVIKPGGKEFGNFLGYVELIEMHARLDSARLYAEADQILAELKSKRIQNEGEKELDRFLTNAAMLVHLSELQMSRNELQKFQSDREQFNVARMWQYLEKIALAQGMQDVAAVATNGAEQSAAVDLDGPERFYQAALARDEALLDNTLEKMTADNLSVAAIVTGGFHTEGIRQRIKAKGYSYAIITPRITKEYDKKLYLSLMMNEQSPFDRILANEGSRLGVVLKMTNELSGESEPEKVTALCAFIMEVLCRGDNSTIGLWMKGLKDTPYGILMEKFSQDFVIDVSDKGLVIHRNNKTRDIVMTASSVIKEGKIVSFKEEVVPPKPVARTDVVVVPTPKVLPTSVEDLRMLIGRTAAEIKTIQQQGLTPAAVIQIKQAIQDAMVAFEELGLRGKADEMAQNDYEGIRKILFDTLISKEFIDSEEYLKKMDFDLALKRLQSSQSQLQWFGPNQTDKDAIYLQNYLNRPELWSKGQIAWVSAFLASYIKIHGIQAFHALPYFRRLLKPGKVIVLPEQARAVASSLREAMVEDEEQVAAMGEKRFYLSADGKRIKELSNEEIVVLLGADAQKINVVASEGSELSIFRRIKQNFYGRSLYLKMAFDFENWIDLGFLPIRDLPRPWSVEWEVNPPASKNYDEEMVHYVQVSYLSQNAWGDNYYWDLSLFAMSILRFVPQTQDEADELQAILQNFLSSGPKVNQWKLSKLQFLWGSISEAEATRIHRFAHALKHQGLLRITAGADEFTMDAEADKLAEKLLRIEGLAMESERESQRQL